MKRNQRKRKKQGIRNAQKKRTIYNKEHQEEFEARKQTQIRAKVRKLKKIHKGRYEKLKKKALRIFNKKNLILTGDGLSRTELRILENREFLKSTMVKTGSGQIVRAWALRHKFNEEIAKITPVEKKPKKVKEKEKKQGLWAKLWAKIKKYFGVKNGKNASDKSD